MPDSGYVGDQAAVLPSNTPALINFSNQFAEQARQQRLQQHEQDVLNQQRLNRVNAAAGTLLMNKSYAASDLDHPILQKMQQDGMANAQNLLQTQGEPAAMQSIYNTAGNLQEGSHLLNNMHAANAASVAAWAKQNPTGDKASLTKLLSAYTFGKRDANGNLIRDNDGNIVQVNDLSELNPDISPMEEVIKDNEPNLYQPGADKSIMDAAIKAHSTYKLNQPATHDAQGNITNYGAVNPKFPGDLMNVVPGPDGKNTAVTKNQPYSMDGQNPYVDQNGQNIKVLPNELQKHFNSLGAVRAKVLGDTNNQLEQANGSGMPGAFQIDKNSAYADMLYKNNMYNYVNDYLKNTPVGIDRQAYKESTNIQNKNFSNAIRSAQLRNSQANTGMRREALDNKEEKDAAGTTDADGNPIKSNFDNITAPANVQTIYNPITSSNTNYIDADKIPKDQYYQLSGNKPSPIHGDVGGVKPINAAGKNVYIVNDDGTLTGDNGIIDKNGADARQIKAIPKSKAVIAPTPAAPRTLIQKAVDKVKSFVAPKTTIRGTNKKMY